MAEMPRIVVPCTCKWPGATCPTHAPTLMARLATFSVVAAALVVGVAVGALASMAIATIAPWWVGAVAITVGYFMWRKWAPR